MNKFILSLLLVFIFFLQIGYFYSARAQGTGRGVTSTSIDGKDVSMWADDYDACTAKRSGFTECQKIADKCVEDGGCAPMLATLQFMGCEKCDALAKPCFDGIENEVQSCIAQAVDKFKTDDPFKDEAELGIGEDDAQTPKGLLFDEAACHESCQSNYDTCTSECRSADIFNNSNSGSDFSASCTEKCNEVYNSTYDSIRKGCFDTWWSCGIKIYNRCASCTEEVEEKCDKPYTVCLQPSQDAADKCLADCGVDTNQGLSADNDACINTCEQTRSTCSQNCRDDGEAAKNRNIPPSQKPQVGVSSKDFKALVKAMNELQVAQAELDKIKAANDPRWMAKKDAAPDPSVVLQNAPPDLLDVLKRNFENDRDIATVLQDAEELYGVYKGGQFGGYGPASAVTDVGNGVINFIELTSEGVPVAHATTKAMLDNAAPSAFMVYPPLYALDKIATMPDRIASSLWVDKKNPIRKITGFVKEYTAPSSFVEKSTDAMVKTGNWTNFGIIYKDMFQDVRDDHTFSGKAWELVKFGYTAVGSIPVAVAMYLKDEVEAVFDGFKNAGELISNVSSWFTYSW